MRVLLLSAVAALAAFCARADGLNPTDVFRAASPAVVTVHGLTAGGAESAQGGGVTIRPSIVVSNCHVVVGASRVELGWGGDRYPADLLVADQARDLCTFRAPALPSPVARIGRSSDMEIGADVYAIGSPQGLRLSLSGGMLSGRREGLLQITAPISRGSSGGGLFNNQGELVGITSAFLPEGQQLNFAIPVEWIAEMRDSAQPITRSSAQAGREALNAWEAHMMKVDPAYEARRGALIEAVKAFVTTLPADQWLHAAEVAYQKLSSVIPSDVVYRCRGPTAGRAYSATYLPGADCVGIRASPGAEASNNDARWFRLRTSTPITEVDTETLVYKDGVGSAWIRGIYEDGTTRLEHYAYNCPARMYSITSVVVHDANGMPLASESPADPAWRPIAPNSINETIEKHLCPPRQKG